jgi:hypothetical protein
MRREPFVEAFSKSFSRRLFKEHNRGINCWIRDTEMTTLYLLSQIPQKWTQSISGLLDVTRKITLVLKIVFISKETSTRLQKIGRVFKVFFYSKSVQNTNWHQLNAPTGHLRIVTLGVD